MIRGDIRTDATGAISPVDFDNLLYKIQPIKEILKIKQDLTELVAKILGFLSESEGHL